MAENPKVLFIIGAGASAASTHSKVFDLLKDPPLANNMGKVLIRVFEMLAQDILSPSTNNRFQELGIDENEYNSWKVFRQTFHSWSYESFVDDYFHGANPELHFNL